MMNIYRHSMYNYISESNLIEGVTSAREIEISLEAWNNFRDVEIITENVILGLHQEVMCNQLKYQLGRYRVTNVIVGAYVCPSHFIVQELMDKWILDMHSLIDILDPKVMHIRFERIHPFIDGNGRIGRMLMWWHEIKLNREPTLITYKNRHRYYEWFENRRT